MADAVHKGIQIAQKAKASAGGGKLKEFMDYIESPQCKEKAEIDALREDVAAMATAFPLPGVGTQNLHFSH